jgi:hypothetical protein
MTRRSRLSRLGGSLVHNLTRSVLLSCLDDMGGLFGPNTTSGGFDLSFGCALASCPSLSDGRAVLGDVVTNHNTGSSVGEPLTSARRRCGAKRYGKQAQ